MMALKKAKRINDQIAEILSIKKESFWSLETKCGLFFSSVKASHSNGKLGMKRNKSITVELSGGRWHTKQQRAARSNYQKLFLVRILMDPSSTDSPLSPLWFLFPFSILSCEKISKAIRKITRDGFCMNFRATFYLLYAKGRELKRRTTACLIFSPTQWRRASFIDPGQDTTHDTPNGSSSVRAQ